MSCYKNLTLPLETKPPDTLPTFTQTPSKIPLLLTTPQPTITRKSQSPTPDSAQGIIPFSPLEGIGITDLPEFVTNKFSPPVVGSDKPHQGVDFSVLDQYTELAVGGNPVQAVLSGVTASVIQDRFPYGNAILVETSLSSISPIILDRIILPTPAPLELHHPVLYCPLLDSMAFPNSRQDTHQSFYLLYAHLDGPSQLLGGDLISQGQILGIIGSSGNALNPHLHLELRVSQSGLQIPSMAHYQTSASLEEMGYYCLWRVSNAFQLIDPMFLFNNQP